MTLKEAQQVQRAHQRVVEAELAMVDSNSDRGRLPDHDERRTALVKAKARWSRLLETLQEKL